MHRSASGLNCSAAASCDRSRSAAAPAAVNFFLVLYRRMADSKCTSHLEALAKERADLVRRMRQGAEASVELMKTQAARSLAAEESDAEGGEDDEYGAVLQPGLIILPETGLIVRTALYGRRAAVQRLSEGSQPPCTATVLDVQIPCQVLVNSAHQLLIPGGRSKSTLPGFYDVAMGHDDKILSIRYEFRRRMHAVSVSDSASLAIPLREHLLDARQTAGGIAQC